VINLLTKSTLFAFLFWTAVVVDVAVAEINKQTDLMVDKNGSGLDEENDLPADENFEIHRTEHPENPCDRSLDRYYYPKLWYDSTHTFINEKFCEPALWFDNFFASDRIFDEGVAGTYIRWRNDFTYDEEEHFEFKMRLSASVQLPAMKNRLRLTFESDEEEDLRDIVPGYSDESTNSLGLQLDLLKKTRSKFSLSVSFKPRIRFRYRYTYLLDETIVLRLTQEVQRERSVHSAKTRFDFEKLFDETFLFRATTEGEVSEEYDGMDWVQTLVLFQRINNKSSLSYETSVRGISKPVWQAIDYRLAFRFRRNFHRKWLFFEISPEMTWPITYDENRLQIERDRRSKWQLFFRLEAHFGNTHKRRYQDYSQLG